MTIAAGFVCQDGILLCADTLYTDGYTKQYGSKIFTWSGSGIAVCFALAGNATLAKMAAEDCSMALHALTWDQQSFAKVYETIRSVLRYVQHEYVDQVPVEERDRSRFYMLVAIHTENSGHRLYSSNDAGLSPVFELECIGGGRQIGFQVLAPAFHTNLKIAQVSILALDALTAAREVVDGVGGDLHLIALHGGTISPVFKDGAKLVEPNALEYRKECGMLLLSIGDPELGDADFEKRLEKFTDRARWYRATQKGKSMEYLKEWLAKLEAQSNPQ